MIGVIDSASGALTAVAAAIERRPKHLQILADIAALGLPDGWVGAGFVRNAVWDDLHAEAGPTPLVDVDVVYFDAMSASPEADKLYEDLLRASAPDVPWSVKNQARMHLRNHDQPYSDTAHALTHWPEICTAVAARLGPGGVEVLAPLGLRDLFDLIVRPTPNLAGKLDVYRARMHAKNWPGRWPRLRIESMD